MAGLRCKYRTFQHFQLRSHQIFKLVINKDSLHIKSHGPRRCCEHVSRELVWDFSRKENHRLDIAIARQKE